MAVKTTVHRLPDDPILVKLLQAAKRVGSSEAIINDHFGYEKTYTELMSDVLKTRERLKSNLPAANFQENGLLCDENVYITSLTRTGYEYVVAFYAVRALGGAYVPLDPKPAVERLAAMLANAQAELILFDHDRVQVLETLRSHIVETEGRSVATVPTAIDYPALSSTDDIVIDYNLHLDPRGPGFVCMTSGTTGYSKGVIVARTCLTSDTVQLTSFPLEERPGAQINYNTVITSSYQQV